MNHTITLAILVTLAAIAWACSGCTMTNCTVTVDVTVLGSRSRNCETYGDDARIRAEVDGGGANSNSATVPLAH
jgi:hypothetical protein